MWNNLFNMDIILGLLLAAAVLGLLADPQHIVELPLIGITNQNVSMACDLPMSSPPRVTWTDTAYNMDSYPAMIFRSENNPSRSVNTTHLNWENIFIGEDFTLTLDHFNMSTGPGTYTCTSLDHTGHVHYKAYYLNVLGSPLNCSGVTSLVEGDSTSLSCHSEFAGTHPSLQWYRGAPKAGEELRAVNEFDIRLARKTLDLTAVTHDDDGQVYTCQMKFGEALKECSVTLAVKHLVRDLRFIPESPGLRVGEELRCVAGGNPSPHVSLSTQVEVKDGEDGNIEEFKGEGQASLKIDSKWVGKQVKITCRATNSVKGKQEAQVKQTTIYIQGFTGSVSTVGIVIGLVIALLILVCIIVAIVLVRRRKNQKTHKGAKPLPTKEQISHSQNGQHAGQHGGQAV